MQAVDGVVRLFDLAHQPHIRILEDGERLAQHVPHAIAHVERLAHGTGERLGSIVDDIGIEMPWCRKVLRFARFGHEPFADFGEAVGEQK